MQSTAWRALLQDVELMRFRAVEIAELGHGDAAFSSGARRGQKALRARQFAQHGNARVGRGAPGRCGAARGMRPPWRLGRLAGGATAPRRHQSSPVIPRVLEGPVRASTASPGPMNTAHLRLANCSRGLVYAEEAYGFAKTGQKRFSLFANFASRRLIASTATIILIFSPTRRMRSGANQTGTKHWLFHWLAPQLNGKNSNESWWTREDSNCVPGMQSIRTSLCVGQTGREPAKLAQFPRPQERRRRCQK
jgi:hypothetical protein